MITDEELLKLDALANQHGIPLVIDNAYGVPFPGIIFSEARPLWNPNIVLCMSLSKLDYRVRAAALSSPMKKSSPPSPI